MKPISVIPTLCTLGNAFCGFLAISKGADAVASLGDGITPESLVEFRHLMATACWLIFLAMIFDALDGRLARLTNVTSDFGACLDSLTDMLTFGAAPALLAKFMFETSLRIQHVEPFKPKFVLLLCVLYVCCAALRLARFTAETEEDPESHDFFRGLPTPAAGGCLSATMLFYLYLGEGSGPQWMQDRMPGFLWGILFLVPVLGLFMVSNVQYVHLVNRYMRGRRPFTYVLQIVFVLFMLALVPEWVLFISGLGYVAAGPILSGTEAMLGRKLVPRTSRRRLREVTPSSTVQAAVAFGSNLGNREEHIERALATLEQMPGISIVQRSDTYETDPVGGPPQPRFLNGVVLVETSLTARELLEHLQEVELEGGRVRRTPNEPRTIDLDLIYFGNEILDEEGLRVPHPRAHQRRFVLEPLAQVDPAWVHPLHKATAAQLLSELTARNG